MVIFQIFPVTIFNDISRLNIDLHVLLCDAVISRKLWNEECHEKVQIHSYGLQDSLARMPTQGRIKGIILIV
jgi:hypothetical protein